MIIAVINQKGGTGKTSTAVHLAYWLHQNAAVRLIDADSQASYSTWIKLLDNGIKVDRLIDPNELADRVPELAKETKYTVIDAAGGISELTRVILYYAKIAIVPCQPTALDLHSSGSVFRLIKQAKGFRGKDLSGAAFVSRAIPRTRLKSEAIAALGSIEDLTKLSTTVHNRQPIADAFGQHKIV